LRTLVLSSSLCHALQILAQIFGRTWDQYVVGELRRDLRRTPPPSGTLLVTMLTSLLQHSSQTNYGLVNRFVITATQIRYRSADRRYMVVILQGQGDEVYLTWQMTTRQAGVSFITYTVSGNSWRCIEWQVSKPCQDDLALLAKIGGEVLGFLAERDLLPPGSPFIQALEAQLSAAVGMRESASQHESSPDLDASRPNQD
jgi:hypothetical protein